MITRIVRLEFSKDGATEFLPKFEEIKFFVNSFPGCLGMQLLNDIKNPNVFFTISNWVSESCLEEYRNSDGFRKTWNAIKPLFIAKPEAWSLTTHFDGRNIIE